MRATPYVLMIAPYAPPQNAAEAIQVRRILGELDQHASGRLVTLAPSGWAQHDDSLALKLEHFDTHYLTLPLHRISSRIAMSHRLRAWHVPDAMRWITCMAGRITRALTTRPDIIYSRSYPMSAALLALKVKQSLGVPWIMHLSDPWADSPYGINDVRNHADEAKCFAHADLITLTTSAQVEHYRKKYPAFAEKITVSPNVMPEPETQRTTPTGDLLHMVFAGNLYGARSAEPLIRVIELLRSTRPELLAKLRIDVYGKAQEPALSQLQSVKAALKHHGAVSFAQAYAAQRAADVILTIEPELDHPLGNSFLPSKVLESLALGKPLLAITPSGSETETLCREGYGWAVAPSDTEALATRIATLVEELPQLRAANLKTPPVRYAVKPMVQALLQQMQALATTKHVLMQGYYGKANFGDDVLMKVTYNLLTEVMPSARIALTLEDAQQTYVSTMLPEVNLLESGQQKHFDMIVHGGGGVFFDFSAYGTLHKALERILPFGLYLSLEKFARKLLCRPRITAPVRVGLGVGVGTYSPGSPRVRHSLPILADFEALWVRDPQSVANLTRFSSVMDAAILQGSDLAFLTEYWLPPLDPSPHRPSRPRLGVVLRDWEGGTPTAKIESILAHLAGEYDITGFIFDANSDSQMQQLLKPYTTHIWQPAAMSIADFAAKLGTQDVLLTSRAHGAICGACLNVPSVIVNIEPKLEQVHAMLPNAGCMVEANETSSWVAALKQARAIPRAMIAEDVARNRAESEAALHAMKRWLA